MSCLLFPMNRIHFFIIFLCLYPQFIIYAFSYFLWASPSHRLRHKPYIGPTHLSALSLASCLSVPCIPYPDALKRTFTVSFTFICTFCLPACTMTDETRPQIFPTNGEKT
jgi:hypothetical protein